MSTAPVSIPYVEPWLRGTHADVPAVGRAVLHALDDLTELDRRADYPSPTEPS